MNPDLVREHWDCLNSAVAREQCAALNRIAQENDRLKGALAMGQENCDAEYARLKREHMLDRLSWGKQLVEYRFRVVNAKRELAELQKVIAEADVEVLGKFDGDLYVKNPTGYDVIAIPSAVRAFCVCVCKEKETAL